MSQPNKTLVGLVDGGPGYPAGPAEGGGSLGSITKTVSALSNGDARTLRFQRQKLARNLLQKERVSRCYWSKISKYVEGWKSTDPGGRAHFRNVMTCGSVWMCPLCAAKITERRKVELESAIVAAELIDLRPFMVTFTVQHDRSDLLGDVVNDLINGIRLLRGRRSWRRFKDHFQIIGSVSALENTYGLSNGWHPHRHDMFFTSRDLMASDYDEIKDEITNEYKNILIKHGRGLSVVHGVDVRGGDAGLADYIAKYGRQPKNDKTWTLAAEMTKGLQKNKLRMEDHYTPFQLLDYSSQDDHAAGLFQAYALTMKGRKFLTFSHGLRDLLGLGVELSDDELAQLNDDRSSMPFALFDGEAWRRARRMPDEVLRGMEQLGFYSFRDWAAAQGIYIEREEITSTLGQPLAEALKIK